MMMIIIIIQDGGENGDRTLSVFRNSDLLVRQMIEWTKRPTEQLRESIILDVGCRGIVAFL